ncbi:unknown [Clostridium sp. CAG:149]|nr:unknown [Clostridium sp. CAG:149]
MGNRGCHRSLAKSEIAHNTHCPGSLSVPVNNGHKGFIFSQDYHSVLYLMLLLYTSGNAQSLSCIFHNAHKNFSVFTGTFQAEIVKIHFPCLHGILLFYLKALLLNRRDQSAVLCHQLSSEEYGLGPHTLQIVEKHHIGRKAGGYGAQMADSCFPGRIDGCTLDRQNRIHAAADGFSDHCVHMAYVEEIITLSVIAAEGQCVKEPLILDSVPDSLHISRDGAFPGIHIHAVSELLSGLRPGCSFMAGPRSSDQISGELSSCHRRGMSLQIQSVFLSGLNNIHHPVIPVHHSVKVHDLCQSHRSLETGQSVDILCKKFSPGILTARHCRHTAWDVHKLAHGKIASRIVHVDNALPSIDISYLMGIVNNRRGSVGDHRLGKVAGRHHGTLNMHVRVDQSRNQITPLPVIHRGSLVRS